RIESPPLPEPPLAQVSSLPPKELFSSIKGLGRNWDDECEALLSSPPTLVRSGSGSSSYYSGDNTFGIIQTAKGLEAASVSLPPSTYGIAIQEKAGSVYLTLADSGRNIIVRMRMVLYGEEPPQRDWNDFKEALKAAVALGASEEAKNGMVAVHDGILRLMPQSKSSGLLRSPTSRSLNLSGAK
ncbi:MAG: hypothetical protein AB1529_05020, partial [Candidatus Micrarchaeota archaeon]